MSASLREKFDSSKDGLAGIFDGAESVELAYLFGSVSRGDEGDLSDIDIAVYLKDGSDFGEMEMRLLNSISDFFDDFDLVIMNRASPLMKYNVVKDGEIIYEESSSRKASIESEIIIKYLDMKPYLERHSNERLEKFAEEGLA